MIPRALISLSGQGDRQFFWVEPRVLAWMNHNETFDGASRRVTVPADVVEILRPDVAGDPDREGAFADAVVNGVRITSGSPDNDKALVLSCWVENYGSLKEAMAAGRRQGWELGDECEGVIY